MRKLLFVTLMLLALITYRPAVAQQMQCADRDRVLSLITDRLGQSLRARGHAGRALVEVFANEDTADWTITVTLPGERTCLLANGRAFEPASGLLPARGTRV